ncbi:hypothetical protein F4678DRAFT_442039 [Xylaria arbuscula]|nr:hypothetical protein F4678DRAFT_442039 [Xylaria arbuscula]
MTVFNGLPLEVWQLIFKELAGDTETLTHVGLVSRLWRVLSLPALLSYVDISSHNNGHFPEEEIEGSLLSGMVVADYSDQWRPENLVPRQRAFLRLMKDRPGLAKYVKAFIWTLVWIDFSDDGLLDIDLHIWDIFGRMQNVTRLDLASLHHITDEPYIRQHPSSLFPAVTHLRLVGWMHRGLVKAIVSSLNATKLVCLDLHHLVDEGALPNGEMIPHEIVKNNPHRNVDWYNDEGINDELWARQERGDAAIFPGPMWFPLRFLRQKSLNSIAHLQLSVVPFFHSIDRRSLISIFNDTASFIISTKNTLKSLTIELGEQPWLICKDEDMGNMCGTSQSRVKGTYRPLRFDQTLAFLRRLLKALAEEQFPHLTRVDLKGFRILLYTTSRQADLDFILQKIREYPFVDEEFLKTANVDFRPTFTGYDVPRLSEGELNLLEEVLERS